MSKRLGIYAILIVLIGGLVWLVAPRGQNMVRAEMNSGGFPYSIKVVGFGERCRIELTFNRKFLVSGYEYYVNSIPPTKATIDWPELHSFVVTFDTGDKVRCSWDDYGVHWENSSRPKNR